MRNTGLHILAFFGLFSLSVQAQELSTPKAELDLGVHFTGPPIQITIPLSNTGDKPLALLGLNSTCGCLRYEFSDTLLPALGTGSLKVVINSLTQPLGESVYKFQIQYRYQDEAKILPIKLRCQLKKQIAVDPPVFSISTSSKKEQLFTITDHRDEKLRVKSAVIKGEGLSAELIPSDTALAGKYLVKLVIDPSKMTNELVQSHLIVATTDTTCPYLIIPVKVIKTVAGKARVFPGHVEFALNRSVDQMSTAVQIRTGGEAADIAKISSSLPSLSFRYSSGKTPLKVIRVVLDTKTAPDSGQCELNIELTNGQKLAIPVTWK